MSIIEQLEQTVTPAVLGDYDSHSSVAHVSLLEQFYAILASRLALPQIYSQLMRADQVLVSDRVVESPLFEQLWQDPAMQQVIIQELSATHHIDVTTTAQLITNAAPLAYRELKILANGQFLPAFLQAAQSTWRTYLPIWSAPVITAAQSFGNEANSSFVVEEFNAPASAILLDKRPNAMNEVIVSKDAIVSTDAIVASTIAASAIAGTATSSENKGTESADIRSTDNIENTNAIHANPAAHHLAENGSIRREEVSTRNQRNDLLVRVFLLIGALAAIGLTAWALFLKPSSVVPVEPVMTAPVVETPAPVAQVLTPVELIVGVDDSGNLYTCSATVGDEMLKGSLQNALNTSFGEQANICTLAVQPGSATSIANIPVEMIPNVLTMLRSTPFARLQLQNDRLTLEAPDSILLQRLVTDIRTLAPALLVESTVPLPLPENNDANTMNGTNNQYGDDYNNGGGEYQESDDDTGDSEMPAPPPNNNNNAPSYVPNNVPNNTSNNVPSNNSNTRPPGPFSPSEVDEMANTVIIAEPAQVRK